MRVTPPSEFTCVATGATARTPGTSAMRSAICTGIGVPLNPMMNEVDCGCTMISAPTPTVRFADSSSIPCVSPTTRRIRIISTATAVTESTVRTGRAARFATISRLTNVVRLFCRLFCRGRLFQVA